MAVLTQSKERTKVGFPPVFKDSVVVRVLEHTFGPSKKDNPMITVKLEVIGVPNNTGGVETEVAQNGQKYKIAGQRLTPVWFTLKEGFPLDQYIDFWKAAHPGEEFTGVDTENPDRGYLDQLALLAMVRVTSQIERKFITDEEKAALLKEGKEPVGDPIIGGDGQPVTRQTVAIESGFGVNPWLGKFTGELPTI
jgi:hypothetical protein